MESIPIDLFDDDDDIPTPWELALTADLPRDDDGEDDLGLRSLYERPEALLGPDGWPAAA